MFTRKDRKIANQKAKIENRDILIRNQQEKITRLESLLKDIEVIASSNLYGTDGKVYLRKIKELSTTLERC
jgi:hypothetical protein